MRLCFPDQDIPVIRRALTAMLRSATSDADLQAMQRTLKSLDRTVRESANPIHTAYRAAAADHQKDGELEFDSDAIVSLSDGNGEGCEGAYVMSWFWIGKEEIKGRVRACE